MKKLISIILPVFDEEKVIPQLCKELKKSTEELKKYDFEIIMVENGSSDNSYDLLLKERTKNKKIKIIQLVKNVGTDGALMVGLSSASGDAAIVMMADLQEHPSLLKNFISKWEEGYEIVYGIVRKRNSVPLIRRAQTFVYYKLIRLITRNLVIENASDFRLMDKKVYKALSQMPEHNIFFRGMVSWTGFKQTGIKFDRLPRYAGKSKAYFSTALRVGLNGIFSFSSVFSYVPLLFSVFAGFIFFGLVFFKQYNLAVFSLLFVLLFLQLSILMEYLRRIYLEALNRPKYIIRERIGFE